MISDGRLRFALATALVAGTFGLMISNHVVWRGGNLEGIEGSRRLWEDFAVAQTRFHANPGDPETSIDDDLTLVGRMRRVMPELVAENEIRPWEVWRTVRVPVRMREPQLRLRETDDHGRSEILFAAFRAIGGVAPMMVLAVGLLSALPVLGWLLGELVAAQRVLAAVLIAVAFASSPFLIMALSLPYAPMGFYLAAVLTLLALSVPAFLGSPGSPLRFAARVAVAGILFVIFLRARSSVVFLAPAFACAVLFGTYRRTANLSSRKRNAWLFASLLIMFGPWLLFRPRGHHEVFLGLWEGLGDFDSTDRHHWNDSKAKDFLEANGRAIPRNTAIWLYDNEDLFRSAFVADVTREPIWYAEILMKRVISSLGLTRLWTERLRALEPSEGTIRVYWAMAPPVNRVRLGASSLDVWPPLLILGAALSARRLGERLLLATAVLGTLLLPVVFTTASGVEVQALGLVYIVASALFLSSLVRPRDTGTA